MDDNGNYVKDSIPFDKLKKLENINNDILSFYMKFNQLKNLYRQGWIKVRLGKEFISKCESVADHSFSIAVLGLTIIEKNKLDYDVEKVLKMCLLHELGEICIGDYTPYDNISKEEKYLKEHNAQKEVLNTLDFDNDFLEIIEEYDEGKTKIAKFVHNLDTLEFIMQAGAYGIDISYCESAVSKITDKYCKEIVKDLIEVTKGYTVPGGD